jgi:cellulose 1,4-beta-cellobiosidase
VTTADGNKTATSAVTVEADQPTTIPVTGVSVTPTATLKVGATTSLTATVEPATASNKAVTWSSSNTSVATVSATGEVKGVAKGTATITVTTADGNKTATSAITVNEDQAANFTLEIGVSGNGSTSLAAGSYSYKSGSSVTITATPAAGNEFSGWSGAFMGNTNPLTITIDGNKKLTAMFAKSGGDTPPPMRVANPYVGADRYIDPEWSGWVKDSANRATADLKDAIAVVAQQPTSIWLDRIAALDTLPTHLDAAVQQQAMKGGNTPMLVELVVYDLPDRDCAALASNGELKVAQNGMARYKSEYIDRIVSILQSKPEYKNLRIVTVIEPDSLPNVVTNTNLPACSTAVSAYKEGVAYAIKQLAAFNNVYIYMDMGNSGWLGWDWGDKAAQVYREVMVNAGGENLVRGFTTNVSNYGALKEPFNPYDNQNQYQALIQNWYEWNRMIDEQTYVTNMLGRFPNHHFLIDTGRSGWKAQPAGVPIENRVHRGNWCNNKNAGLGERPRVEPMAGVDAFVWIKPPGTSDGSSDASQSGADAEGKSFDAMCGTAPVVRSYSKGQAIPTDALSGAPAAGKWFDAHFFQLMRNATPAVDTSGSNNQPTPMPDPTPTPKAPAEPANLGGSVVNGSVVLTWSDNSDNEQGFLVERRVSNASTWTTLTKTAANAKSYTDGTAAAGNTYEYRVSAFNATGNSAAIATSVVVQKAADPVPAAPSGLTTKVIDNGAVDLAWSDNSGNETGFRVERRVMGDANWTKLADTAANTKTYSDAKVPMGKSYEYRVSAYNTTGSSAATTASATLQTFLQYGEQMYNDPTQSCASSRCHGPAATKKLFSHTAADFATMVKAIEDTMPDDTNRLCVNNCAKGTAAYIIKLQTGVTVDENGSAGGSGGSGGTPVTGGACKGGELFCEDFESFTSSTATSNAWTIENDNPGFASVAIDGTHARGNKALHISTTDNGMAFLVPTTFSPPNNSFYGRMWLWVDAFPTKPDYAHFTLVEASGTFSGTKVRPIGGQYIPGNSQALWGVGSDGGPTGDWTSWQTTTPTAGGKWTCMEWQMSAADNAVNVWIDGVAKPEMSVSTAKNHGSSTADFIFPTFNKIRFGWQLYQGNATPPKYNIWLDDLTLSTTRIGCGNP